MAYCTLADLTAQYGARILIDATDRGDVATGLVDEAAVTRAIASGDAMIDGYLKARYALPLASVPPLVNELSMAVALYKLHVHVAGEKVTADYKDAVARLKDIASGAIRLDVAGTEPAPAGTSGARITDRDRPMTAQNLRGYY